MKRTIIIIFAFSMCLVLNSQQALKEVTRRVEVPVRIYDGQRAVQNLTIDDFEILEDGKRQNIEALYLIKNNYILGGERSGKLLPDTDRNFYIFSEISTCTPEIEITLERFVRNILRPGDNLVVITPKNIYQMKPAAIEKMPLREFLSQLKSVFHIDALSSQSAYQNVIDDLNNVTHAVALAAARPGASETGPTVDKATENMSTDALLTRYTSLLFRLIETRKIRERKYLEYAGLLPYLKGQKYAFLFYQRESIPQLDLRLLEDYLNLNQGRQDIIRNLTYVPDFLSRDFRFSGERISRTFSDMSISLHFCFFDIAGDESMNPAAKKSLAESTHRFNIIAQQTGGFVDCSQKPEKILENFEEAFDNYYLLYYTPPYSPGKDKFKKIEVRVKGKEYSVYHRSGYYSN